MDGSDESLKLLDMNKSDPGELDNKDTATRSWSDSLKGILAGILSTISHIMGATSVQLLERRVPDLELQVFRSVAIVLFSILWIVYHLQSPKVPKRDLPATVLYALIISVESTAIYTSFALAPASAAQCSMTTVILLCGLIVFGLCGTEKIGPAKVLFVLLCVAGVVFVIQPWHKHKYDQAVNNSEVINDLDTKLNCTSTAEVLCELNIMQANIDEFNLCTKQLLTNQNRTVEIHENQEFCNNILTMKANPELCSHLRTCWLQSLNNSRQATQQTGLKEANLLLFSIPQGYVTTIGVAVAGFGGLMYTMLTLVIKMYPCLSENRFRSLFWAFLTCLVCSTSLTFVLEDPVWPVTLLDIAAVSVHCIASVSTWFCAVYAMQYASGTVVSIILSSSVVLFLIPQYTVLSAVLPGHRNWMEVVGVFMVLLGSISGSLYELFCTTETQ